MSAMPKAAIAGRARQRKQKWREPGLAPLFRRGAGSSSREEGVVDAADADKGDRRAVMQGDGRVAAGCRGRADDIRDRIGRAVQRYAVAAGLAEGRHGIVTGRGRAVVPQGLVAAGKAHQSRPAARGSLDRVVRAAPDCRIAAAGDDRLITRRAVEEGVGGAAGDRLAGDAGDRLIAAAAALGRFAGAAPDRLVAAAAADDRLIAAGAIDEFVAAAATGDRVARSAADRLVAAPAAADRVARAAPRSAER